MNIVNVQSDKLAALILQTLDQSAKQKLSLECIDPIYLAFRQGGQLIEQSWQNETTDLSNILHKAITRIKKESKLRHVETLEIVLTYSYQSVAFDDFLETFPKITQGIKGIEMKYGSQLDRISPTEMIATNQSFLEVFNHFLVNQGSILVETFYDKGGIVREFETKQFLIYLQPSLRVIPLYRGNCVVQPEEFSGEVLLDMTHGMGKWLLNQVQVDGRMIYQYFPGKNEESNANNMIRQFMATLALIRYAKFTQNHFYLAVATRNLKFNLDNFYRLEENIGLIEYKNKVKLGAIALAALAILEHPHNEPFQEILQGLCRGIDKLWNSDGSFRTFYKPRNRNDNQNFYPGEALLFWVSLYSQTQHSEQLKKCQQSFSYYRTWHRENRNPAFIPWHTQAYFKLFAVTQDPELQKFIFEINDWLLGMHQWYGVKYPDIKGRFYNPLRQEYGVPHASATGVYLEGLADAYYLAETLGDANRADLYYKAIWRGLRSVRQLQFKNDIDMFYISQQDRVKGGIRTTVYDNSIRVDNVQHCLMALLKLCQWSEFTEKKPQF